MQSHDRDTTINGLCLKPSKLPFETTCLHMRRVPVADLTKFAKVINALKEVGRKVSTF